MSGTTSDTNDIASFDAVTLLGFAPTQPMPKPEPGTILIRYGGWSLLDLREKQQCLFLTQDWYDQFRWASEKLPSGLYALRLPIPNSNRKTFDEQRSLLLPNEEPAHVVLAATALLSLCRFGLADPLQNVWIRTGQQAAGGRRVGMGWNDGHLIVNDWGDGRTDVFWLASARKAF